MEIQKNLSPYAGAFGEAAAMTRELVEQGKMTAENALQITNEVYRRRMIEELLDYPTAGDRPEELPEDLWRFPGATYPDGRVRFSS